MTADLRLVGAGGALLLCSSLLFLPTRIDPGFSVLLALVAAAGLAAGAVRSTRRGRWL